VTGAPREALSRRNWTLETPTLSEALAETITVPEALMPDAGVVREIWGGVVSEGEVEEEEPLPPELLVVVGPMVSKAAGLLSLLYSVAIQSAERTVFEIRTSWRSPLTPKLGPFPIHKGLVFVAMLNWPPFPWVSVRTPLMYTFDEMIGLFVTTTSAQPFGVTLEFWA